MTSLEELPELKARYAEDPAFSMLAVARGQFALELDDFTLPRCGFRVSG